MDPSDKDNGAIINAVAGGHTEIVELLLADDRVNPSDSGNLSVGITIKMAASEGRTEIVKLLLDDSRVNPGADNNYAIKKAVSKGHINVVKLLLGDSRVNPAEDNYAIRKAVKKGYIRIARLLLLDTRVIRELQNDDELMGKLCNNQEILEIIKTVYPYIAYEKCGDSKRADLYQRIISNMYGEYRLRPGMAGYSRAKDSFYAKEGSSIGKLTAKQYINIVVAILRQIAESPMYDELLQKIKDMLSTEDNITKYEQQHYSLEKQVYRGIYRTDRNTIIKILRLLYTYTLSDNQ